MIETELKIALDAQAEARLLKHPALAELRQVPRRTQSLVSTYFDTPAHALAAAGISLRLRKLGRQWVQTVKFAAKEGEAAGGGLFARREIERPVSGGQLALDGGEPAFAAITEASGGAPLAPVFETRVRRTLERLTAPGGGTVELAIDHGEIVASAARAPIREAELELVEGDVGALYALARRLFTRGPVCFGTENKAARGYALALGIPDSLPAEAPGPRRAGQMAFAADATLEGAARDIFRDCLAQITANLATVAESDAPEGPHQLRVGLRRLRTAFTVFEPILGGPAMEPLDASARELGGRVGALRDLDVLVEEIVAEASGFGLDATARGALEAALEARRTVMRAEVRAVLAGAETVGFVFDLAAFTEARGWLAPGDWAQSERLATPIGAVAPSILDRRHRAVRRKGRHFDRLDAEGLHTLRKELKKLRYAAEMLDPLYPGKPARHYVKTLKLLQETFGSLNDAATAQELLGSEAAVGRDDPAVQRGSGWVLGSLAVRTAADRPFLAKHWKRFVATEPYWT